MAASAPHACGGSSDAVSGGRCSFLPAIPAPHTHLPVNGLHRGGVIVTCWVLACEEHVGCLQVQGSLRGGVVGKLWGGDDWHGEGGGGDNGWPAAAD